MSASDAPGSGEPDSSPELPPNRRSTFEPPATGPGGGAGADDDALAAALAEELNRATRTGSIPIQGPPATYPEDDPFAEEAPVTDPAPVQPAPPQDASPLGGDPLPQEEAPLGGEAPEEPLYDTPPVTAPAPFEEQPSDAPVWSLDDVPPASPPPAAEPPVSEPPVAESPISEPSADEQLAYEPPVYGPPVFESPVPESPVPESPGSEQSLWTSPESMAASMPAAPLPPVSVPPPPVDQSTSPAGSAPLAPPVRQSLPDDALAQWIGDGATLEAMEQLEREASLRQQDAAAFRDWEQSMLAMGTPEALAALDHARAGFSDVLASGASAPSAPSVSTVDTPTPPPEPTPAPEAPSSEQPLHAPSEPPHAAPPEAELPLAPLGHDDGAELNAAQLADLAHAPAPQSLPHSDIPPPPGEPAPGGWDYTDTGAAAAAPEAEDAAGDGIPDLIEPSPPVADGADVTGVGGGFEAFLAETGLAQPSPDSPQEQPPQDFAEEASPFPLAVYEQGEEVPQTIDLESPRAFRVELAGLEPTPLEQRVGRSARLFWMWFAANSSVISVGLGAVILSLGMSLRQAVIATLVGVSISSLPLGIGALAGKRSGQPTMVISRATFGLLGNILPSVIALLTRIFWGAVLLWLLALGAAAVNESTGALAPDASTVAAVGLGVAFVIVAAIAFLGYGLIARVQATLTILASVLVVGFIMLGWPAVDLRAAMRVSDGDWMLLATGAVLVFSVLGLAWAMSTSDVARYQHPHSSGPGTMLWSWAGAALPAFLLIAYGSLLAASDPELATGLLERPIEALLLLAPAPVVYGMLAVLAVGLLSGAIMTVYSGGFAAQALGLRAPRSVVTVIVAVLTGAAAAGILFTLADFETLVRDLATTIAVPVAAWVGVFAGELMLRGRRFHWESLVRRGGVYPDVRWVNLATLVVATAVGYAFTSAAVSWLSWQGFGWSLLGLEPDSVLASTDLGVVAALLLALIVTVSSAKRAIDAQERDEQATGPLTPAPTPEDRAGRELD